MQVRPESSSEAWRAVLEESDPRRAFARVVVDPVFQLGERCVERMRSAAVLLDLERVRLAAAARVALHAPELASIRALDAWLDACIDRAIGGLVDEDAIEERDDRPVDEHDERYAALAAQLRTDARTSRRAAVVFQRLPHEERAAFWSVVIDGESLEQHALSTAVPIVVARRRFERAIASICSLGAQSMSRSTAFEEGLP